MALEELLRKARGSEDVDYLREGPRAMALNEVELRQHLGKKLRGLWPLGPILYGIREPVT